MDKDYRKIVFRAILDVFEESYDKYFKDKKKYSIEELAYSSIDNLEYNIDDIFSQSFAPKIQKLIDSIESAKRLKVYRLLQKFEKDKNLFNKVVQEDLNLKLEDEKEFNKKYPILVGINNVKEAVVSRHEAILKEWQENYYKFNIVEFPYLSFTSSEQVIFRFLETDIRLFIHKYSLETINNDKNTLLYMNGMSSFSSLYPNKKVVLKKDKELLVETTTMTAKYPSIRDMDAKIIEMNIRDLAIKESILYQLNSDDINTLAYILNHMKYSLIQGETSGFVDIRKIANQLYSSTSAYTKTKILQSFFNLYIVNIIKDGYAFRFLSSFGYNQDVDKNKIFFNIEKELSKQLLSREIYSMDANALKKLSTQSARTLYVPLSILRMGKYLGNKTTILSDKEVLLNFNWFSSNISINSKENPSDTVRRIKESLNELVNSKKLIKSYRFEKTDFFVIFMDIDKEDEAFIQQSYMNNSNLLAEYVRNQNSIDTVDEMKKLP